MQGPRIRRHREKRRNIIHTTLGGECVSCGITDFRVLDVDHIAGGGGRELKETRARNGVDHAWLVLRDQGLEVLNKKFQLLCRNCNWLKHLDTLTQKRSA